MKHYLLSAICGIILCYPLCGHATEFTNIPYRDTSDAYCQERCLLDVYYPESVAQSDRLVPVVVWFHGGGLVGGNKFIPDSLKNSDLVVVAANYRFMSHVPIEDCIRDAAAVVSWTMANAETYHGDTHKIIVAGHSAGGYLTSMIGLDKRWLKPYGIDPDSLWCLAPYSGQAVTHFEYRRRQGISELQPTLDDLAPLSHLRSGIPPMLIISGDREQELFGRYEEQAYFWRMLRLNGNDQTELFEIKEYDHGGMAEPAHGILKEWIRVHLLITSILSPAH